jgi:hypothetical protein
MNSELNITPIEMQKNSKPLTKFDVPSIGSITKYKSWSDNFSFEFSSSSEINFAPGKFFSKNSFEI